jgi:hypothetical protein
MFCEALVLADDHLHIRAPLLSPPSCRSGGDSSSISSGSSSGSSTERVYKMSK